MAVRVRRRWPRHFPPPEGIRGLEETRAADLLVTLRSELGAKKLPFVRVEQYGIAVRSQVDARPIFQVGHLGRLPNLLAGVRLQANQFARRFGGEQIIALE